MRSYDIVGYLLIGIFTSPLVIFLLGFAVFFLVKMGRYGYLMANKQAFFQGQEASWTEKQRHPESSD